VFPRRYARLFRAHARLLASHRGWDPGALAAARELARTTGAPLVAATTTRLLVDLNRSPHNPAVFSRLTRGLPRQQRAVLLARHHEPHWQRVRREIARLRTGGALVVHLAVHSFTPVWRGRARGFDVGLLYDPQRAAERSFAARWRERLTEQEPALRVRRNAPYRGDADGLTSALRRELPARAYLGLELELSQRQLAAPGARRRLLGRLLASLRAGLADP